MDTTTWARIAGTVLAAGCLCATGAAQEPAPAAEGLAEVARLEAGKQRADGRLAALLGADPDARVRRAAAFALARIHHPGDAPALGKALADPDAGVVCAAAFALGLLHEGETRAPAAPLIPFCSDPRAEVRAAVCEALGRIGDPETCEVIRAGLADASPAVRGAAALACWRLRDRRPTPEAGKADPYTARVYAAVGPVVLALSRETDADARWKLMYALAELRRPTPRRGPAPPALAPEERDRLTALVLPALGDGDRAVRVNAALAVARLLGPAAAGPVLPLLRDPDWIVRVYAARALAKVEDPAVGVALRGLAAADPHPLVRQAVLETLATRKDAEAIPAVRACLAHESPTVRRAALGAWATLRAAEGVPEIRAALDDKVAPVRVAAIAALAAADPEKAGPLLRARYDAGDAKERAAVMGALEKVPPAVAADLAEAGVKSDVLEVRGTAVEVLQTRAADLKKAGRDAVPALMATWAACAGREWYETRGTLCAALAAWGAPPADATPKPAPDPRVVAALRAALDDPYRAVRDAAAKGLKECLGGEAPKVSDQPDPVAPGRPDPVAARTARLPRLLRLETNKGVIVCELFREEAPVHVASLAALVAKRTYDGIPFHRVETGFVIQGGDPRGTGWGDAGYTLNNEVNPRPYVRGTLGMPDAGLDTGGCQIFITHWPTPHLDARYTAYGQVIEGFDVVDRIEVGDVIVKATVE